MALHIRRVAYYYVMVKDRPGESYRLLSLLAQQGVDLGLQRSALGSEARLVLFADTSSTAPCAAAGWAESPHALLITGDAAWAPAEIHRKLAGEINVFSSNGVTDSAGWLPDPREAGTSRGPRGGRLARSSGARGLGRRLGDVGLFGEDRV
jgi:hypothetical protein